MLNCGCIRARTHVVSLFFIGPIIAELYQQTLDVSQTVERHSKALVGC